MQQPGVGTDYFRASCILTQPSALSSEGCSRVQETRAPGVGSSGSERSTSPVLFSGEETGEAGCLKCEAPEVRTFSLSLSRVRSRVSTRLRDFVCSGMCLRPKCFGVRSVTQSCKYQTLSNPMKMQGTSPDFLNPKRTKTNPASPPKPTLVGAAPQSHVWPDPEGPALLTGKANRLSSKFSTLSLGSTAAS